MKPSHKTLLLWSLLGLVFLAVFWSSQDASDDQEKKSVKDLMVLVATPESATSIEKIIVEPLGDDSARYVIHFVGDRPKTVVTGPYSGVGNSLTMAMTLNDVSWAVREREESSFWQRLLISWLPMALLVLLFFYFMRRMQGGGSGVMNFGKSKAKLLNETQTQVTFKDVAGIEEAQEEVEEIIAFLKNPPKFTRLGGRIPKGVLLMGSPGSGKTLLARAIAGEAGVPFYSISGSDFVEMFVGVGASRVRDLFEQGQKNAPCIIFIDEIDAVGRHRGAGLGGGHDEREQTLNQLLVEMDGFESNVGVIVVAATNRPDVLDPALLRPGRFDRRIYVSTPDVRGRLDILKIHTRKVVMDDQVDLAAIAKGTPGLSGADLQNLTNEGALLAARREKDRVEMVDFEDAKDKVLMGAARPSMFISETEKRNTAIHEAGHALVALLIGGEDVDPVHKVTIIPRGGSLGLTQQLPTEDRLSLTREYTLNRICILMGGRCAEELVLQQRTTGAGNDLKQTTDLARKMVTEWGMSERLGPLKYSKGRHQVFLGLEMTQKADHLSEETARTIDAEVGRIAREQSDRAMKLLRRHVPALRALAEALLERETLSGPEAIALVSSHRAGEA